jgi:DNA-binding NtrC family response regulator
MKGEAMVEKPTGARGERILVVDDDELVCSSLKWLLLDEGYTVEVAADGKSALSILSRQSFDLVLTDLMMPDVDGLAVLHEVKRISPNTAVIILTGYGTLEAAMAALKDGAYDFLTKPCDDGEMKYKIQGALEQKWLRTHLSEVEGAAEKLVAAAELLARFSEHLDREIKRLARLSGDELRKGLAGLKERFDELRRVLDPSGKKPDAGKKP